LSESDKISFSGTIDPKGHVKPDEVGVTRGRLARWIGRRVTVVVSRYVKQRSNNQNAWYWSTIVPTVAGYLSQGRVLPLSNDQAHYVLKSAFIGQEETPLGPVPCSSAALTTAQFSEYVERIRAHAATEWKLPIPGPGEYWDDEGVA